MNRKLMVRFALGMAAVMVAVVALESQADARCGKKWRNRGGCGSSCEASCGCEAEPSCGCPAAEESSCAAPEPSCGCAAPEPSCGCEKSCGCDNGCGRKHRFRRNRGGCCNGGCEASCGCSNGAVESDSSEETTSVPEPPTT